MNVVAIIQARMSSSRLPGKVLLPLAGKPVIEHVVSRVRQCKNINQIVLATSTESDDSVLEAWCLLYGVDCFRGSLNDVLDRYYNAAKHYKADAVVRITADCPAVDPSIIDEVIEGFMIGNYDAYSLGGEFPDGLDCQVFAFSALERAWHEASLASEREHVGPYIENNKRDQFKVGSLIKFEGCAHHRWTLDEASDYEFLSLVFQRLNGAEKIFNAAQILALMSREPSLMLINNNIIRNEGLVHSLGQDKISEKH